jgi:prepilin-type N-terminal cleavage/methylation domain-containing protein
MGRRAPERRAGFTLIELMAAVFLTAVVLTLAVNVFIDLSRQADAAVHLVSGARRATSVLDRIASDLERAVLVQRAPGQDPLSHPWLFLAERGEHGADRLKFVTRGRRPRGDDDGADLELVAWQLEVSPDGVGELRRSSALQLPEGLDRDLPGREDSSLVAENVAEFGVWFLGGETGRTDEWDSSTVEHSDDLPFAAEIRLSLYRNWESEEIDGPYTRSVFLPLRPLDLATILEAAGGEGGGEDGEEESSGAEGLSMAECLDRNLGLLAQLDPETVEVLRSLPSATQAEAQGLLDFELPGNCR